MLKYIIRRVLYMIPTVLGVILITFLLFNVAGGDPGIMKLGKTATPKTLEDYDQARGYNKPLFVGLWGTTRAHDDSDLKSGPGAWKSIDGVEYDRDAALVRMSGEGAYAPPLAFELDDGERYRWTFRYRLTSGNGGTSPAARFVVRAGEDELASAPLSGGSGWQTAKVAFEVPEDAGDLTHMFDVTDGTLEIRSSSLRRRVAHVFDSQLFFYFAQIGRFDFGVSAETNQKVTRMLRDGVLPSLALTVPMFLCGLVLSVSLSLVCAFFRNTFIDRFFVFISVVLMSVNYLVWIILGQYVLAYRLRLFPVWGFESPRHLVLPIMIGVITGLGGSLRFYRTVMLDEMYRDYVRTAFSKGVGRTGVLFRHVLKNAMIPILTSVVLTIPFLFTGSLLLESFFGIPGLGSMAINGINSSDFDVIRVLVLVGAVLYVVFNLVTDICYAAVDPRVKLK